VINSSVRRITAAAALVLAAAAVLWSLDSRDERQEEDPSISKASSDRTHPPTAPAMRHDNIDVSSVAPDAGSVRGASVHEGKPVVDDPAFIRTAVRKALYSAQRFVDAAQQLEGRYGSENPELLRELFQLQQMCSSIIGPHLRTVQTLDSRQGNWALAGLLDQCEGFAFKGERLKGAGIAPVDLWTEFNVRGPDTPGLRERMVDVIRSGGRPAGETAMMMAQLNQVGGLDGLQLRPHGSQEPISPMVFDVALDLWYCERLGGCGPTSVPTRLFCVSISPCRPGTTLEVAVREGLSPRDARDVGAILGWLRMPNGP
jgi:hypothetical protein